MPLSSSQLRHLRGLAHALKPIVMVGQKGVSDTVVAELDAALACHELVKVRASGVDRDEKAGIAETLRERTGAELVQRIGHVLCYYRRNPDEPRIELPRR